MKTAYVKRSDVYNLFDVHGVGFLHVSDIDVLPIKEINEISERMIGKAEQCLIDNGIEPDEAPVVLQALGYILLDEELYPEV